MLTVGRYPVRDPFFKMLPRSLQNFMNAFTSADYTMYPFATTNAQDFKNLMSVYLDATLHPLLKHSDFVQEGWRIGPENPQAAPSEQEAKDLIFKGVVYNEMKGQMSDAMTLVSDHWAVHTQSSGTVQSAKVPMLRPCQTDTRALCSGFVCYKAHNL